MVKDSEVEMKGLDVTKKIRCDTCPRCKDIYPPDKVDSFGNHFCICGMGGNMVYPKPRKEKRYNGKGYIHYDVDGCGLYDTVEDALSHMSEPERQWYYESLNKREAAKHDE